MSIALSDSGVAMNLGALSGDEIDAPIAVHVSQMSSIRSEVKVPGRADAGIDGDGCRPFNDPIRALAIGAAIDRHGMTAATGISLEKVGKAVRIQIDEIDQKQLPAELQKLDRNELQKRIAKARDERADLQKQIVEVSKKREAYIQSENKRLAAEGKGDAFDQKVTETLHAQAAKKGISY